MEKALNKKILTILLVVALGVFLAGASFAWRGEYQGKIAVKPGWQSRNLNQERVRWQERLNLTQEQREKIAQLRLSFQEETLDLRNQLQKKGIELQKLWLEENPDKNKIYSILDEIARIRAEINKKLVDYLLELKKILTPEQLEKIPFFSRWYTGKGLWKGHFFSRWG